MIPIEIVKEVIRLHDSTALPLRQIANIVHISRGTVANIVRTNGVRAIPQSLDEKHNGKKTCFRCGRPLPCIECAIITKRESGTQGKEPPNGDELILGLDDHNQLDEEGTTVAKAAATIREGWSESTRQSRLGLKETLTIPTVKQTPMRDGVIPGKER